MIVMVIMIIRLLMGEVSIGRRMRWRRLLAGASSAGSFARVTSARRDGSYSGGGGLADGDSAFRWAIRGGFSG
jgi:hypothetical protein